ncbi:Dihydrolipoamide dehydrogenase [Cynara cardunculus var. scolymus]|uniref:Dihydrolipoamide dehydrogenase n=1 Tax=Cynara cardunculus var. scolymus TaxID=59895 RepID=A0A103XF73_CYNCS|nr:Dihydrolipoamide dehydrogenase [Cynara cardunculus var. scolymus]
MAMMANLARRKATNIIISSDALRYSFSLSSTFSRGFASGSDDNDVVVIGGGPGGYVAAIKAAQLGLKTTCIEKRGALGGTCLNVGCIPSKALLHSSHMYHEAKTSFAKHGVKFDNVEIDLAAMMGQKDKAVSNLTKGIESLFKKNKVTYVKGYGKFLSPSEVSVDTLEGENTVVKGKNIIIATGSDVKGLPGITIDEKRIVSSTGALALTEIPKKLIVIGAGYIGLEMGSVWARLGSEVTVVEFAPDIVPSMDDKRFSTNVKGVFAIGDVIPGPMLAHKAEEDGIACVEYIAGKEGHVDYDKVPGVVYTHPEVASVGKTEEQVKELGIAYTVGKFPMLGNSRAKSIDDAEGLVKIIAEKETDKVLGVHIMCSNAGELIHEAALALTYDASSEDIARTCHAHPTLSEAIRRPQHTLHQIPTSGNPNSGEKATATAEPQKGFQSNTILGKPFEDVKEHYTIGRELGREMAMMANLARRKATNIIISSGGDQSILEADVVLVSAGRNPFTAGLGLENIGVETDKIGRIPVDKRFSTNVKGVFAIGDVIPGPMLAHKAEEDGIACVEYIAGKEGHVDYDKVPGVVYTHPEVASVGKTEEQVKELGIAYTVGKFPMLGNSRAKSIDDAEGLVKIIAEKETDKVLGVHIMCSNAGELIHEAALALTYDASSEDIARTCHAHPTLSEAVKEAAMATYDKAIHI